MLGMGRIDAAGLAYEQSVLSTNSAAACEPSNVGDSITNRCVALVRRPDPAGLSPAPKTLAGAGGTGWCFAELTDPFEPSKMCRHDLYFDVDNRFPENQTLAL
jgi:hypothetical protein